MCSSDLMVKASKVGFFSLIVSCVIGETAGVFDGEHGSNHCGSSVWQMPAVSAGEDREEGLKEVRCHFAWPVIGVGELK